MKNLQILIADDDHAFREVMGAALTNAGYKVILAEKIFEAKTKLNNQKFDCVLLDYRFEYHTAEEILRMMRTDKHGLNHETPVLVISGSLERPIVERIANLVNGMLVKPFDTQTLLNMLDAVLASPQKRMHP